MNGGMIGLLLRLFIGGTLGSFFHGFGCYSRIYEQHMETKRGEALMEKMTKKEMIAFLKGMDKRKEYLENEKSRLKGSVETLEEAIQRNTFSKPDDDAGAVSGTFSPDKVFRVLLNSQRDIEEETKSMVYRMRDIYSAEDQIDFVRYCLLQLNGDDQFLLNEIYVKDAMIENMMKTLSMSQSNVYRLLQRALERLLEVYNSGCQEAVSRKADRLITEIRPFLPEGSIA